MIFYFSGTGNSLAIANQLSTLLNDTTVSITELLQSNAPEYTFQVAEHERILFVFPIHSWGVAVPVNQFIQRLSLKRYNKQPIYAVSTCGDDCGLANKRLRKTLRQQGFALTNFFSIAMPNNYILMKGFDVDSNEVATQKLNAAPQRVKAIAEAITQQRQESLYHKGTFSWLKSYLIYPLFVKYAIRQKGFRYTDACISCNLCERICPTRTITMHEGHPSWGNTCVQCTACIHRCPVQAIEFADVSVKKGRYHHPDLK